MLNIFDLDHTLLKVNSSSAFFTYLLRKKILPRRIRLQALWLALRYHFTKLNLKQLHEEVFRRFLKGRKLSDLKAHVEEFLDQFLDKALCFDIACVFRRAQHLGQTTALISTSPLFLVLPIGKRLGFDHIIASRYGLDAKGVMTHIEEVVDGKSKATYARQIADQLHLPKSSISAYSDSIEDLPLLRAVGHPVAVGPCKRLSLVALRRNIPIF